MGFGAGRKEILVLLNRQHAHSRNGLRGSLLMKHAILTKTHLGIGICTLNEVILFVEAVQPDLPVRVII